MEIEFVTFLKLFYTAHNYQLPKKQNPLKALHRQILCYSRGSKE